MSHLRVVLINYYCYYSYCVVKSLFCTVPAVIMTSSVSTLVDFWNAE
jgi:hypothetical protein